MIGPGTAGWVIVPYTLPVGTGRGAASLIVAAIERVDTATPLTAAAVDGSGGQIAGLASVAVGIDLVRGIGIGEMVGGCNRRRGNGEVERMWSRVGGRLGEGLGGLLVRVGDSKIVVVVVAVVVGGGTGENGGDEAMMEGGECLCCLW